MSLKINKRQFKLWIAALDSGEYKQGTYYLQSRFGYCCLGVGCRVTIPEKLMSRDEMGFIIGSIPGDQPAAPQWLVDIDEDFIDKTGHSLTYVNDGLQYTFPEIATLLELVYIHKILD